MWRIGIAILSLGLAGCGSEAGGSAGPGPSVTSEAGHDSSAAQDASGQDAPTGKDATDDGVSLPDGLPPTPPAGPALFVGSEPVAGSANVRFPSIAAYGDTVYLAGSAAEQATVWSRKAHEIAFASPFVAGAARGQPDYASSVVHAYSDGSVLAAWIEVFEIP